MSKNHHHVRGEGGKLPKKTIIRIFLTLSAILFAITITIPVFAKSGGGGHLWFYSQDPDSLPGPQPLPNPQDYDPKYVAHSSDPWLDESVVIPSSDWETPFTIWLACAQFESLNTKLVISINTAAYNAINRITVNSSEITCWKSGKPDALAPHGVFNSAEFHGYNESIIGNLYSPPGSPYKTAIIIDIDLKVGADLTNAKIHFDAYGYTNEGKIIFSPYSHDLNFVIPEPATISLTMASILAFGIYAYKCKR
jgi:hypothetical protein